LLGGVVKSTPPNFLSGNILFVRYLIATCRLQDGRKEIARLIADADGNYRVALPPGDYNLDVQGRGKGHARAKPQRLTVVSKQIARFYVDMDTGIR
jgi:hypothetical protein